MLTRCYVEENGELNLINVHSVIVTYGFKYLDNIETVAFIFKVLTKILILTITLYFRSRLIICRVYIFMLLILKTIIVQSIMVYVEPE